MKLSAKMPKAVCALVLSGTLLVVGWRAMHLPPPGYVEVVVNVPDDARAVVTTNLSTRKAPREKINFYASSCAFEQTIRLPLRVPVVHSVALAWRDDPGVRQKPQVRLIRLLDRNGKTVRESAATESQWKLPKPVTLSRVSSWRDHVGWLGIVTIAGGVVLAAWFGWQARGWLVAGTLRATPFLGVIVFTFLAAAAVYFGLISLQRRGPLLAEVWLHDLAMEKYAIAHAMASPRTFVVGGSSGLYGVDTAWLSQESGQAVVNLGTHGGLPLETQLDWWDELFREGDTVLFHLEYSYWTKRRSSDWIVEQTLGWTARVRRPPWQDPPPWDLITDVPPQRLLAGLLALSHQEAYFTPQPGKVDVPGWGEDWHFSPMRAKLNHHGDLLVNGLPKGGDPKKVAYVSSGFVEQGNSALDELQRFIDRMKERKVSVCFAWPATIRSELCDFTKPIASEWATGALRWIARSGAFAAGTPAETQQPYEEFYDTNYHLTPDARQIHSKTLLRQLKEIGWPGEMHAAGEK